MAVDPTINPRTEQAYRLLHNGLQALARAERHGIRVDLDYVGKKKVSLQRHINRKESALKQTNFYRRWEHIMHNRININSPTQLATVLYKHMKIKPPFYTDKDNPATSEDALKQLNMPELDMIIEIRKLHKIRDTYLTSFEREAVDGVIHPFFNLHLVRTFRSSSDSPNFQNIPKRDKEAMQIVRKALFPRPGHQLLAIDFGSLEVRIAACHHKDETMLNYIHTGKDMHRDMCEQLFMIEYNGSDDHKYLRAATKNGFVFPQFYGDYYGNNAESLACDWGKLPRGRWRDGQGVSVDGDKLSTHLRTQGLKSLDAYTEHVKAIEHDFWTRRFPDYARWKDTWWKLYQKYGYIDMLTGFRCSGVMHHNDAINYPVQGAAFHCLLWSFIQADRELYGGEWKSRIIGQIHDEIIFDVHPPELDNLVTLIKEITTKKLPEAWSWIIVPLEVDADVCPVDGSWAEREPYKFK